MDRSIHPEVIGEEASMRDSKDTDGISIQGPGAERRRRSIAIAYCAVAWLSAALIYGFTFREAQSFFEVNLGRWGTRPYLTGFYLAAMAVGWLFLSSHQLLRRRWARAAWTIWSFGWGVAILADRQFMEHRDGR